LIPPHSSLRKKMHYKKCKNGELKSNSYTKKVLLLKRPMVSFFKLLEVHIPLFNVNNIWKKNVRLVMSNNNIKIINILAPQLMTYDFKSNKPGLVTFRNGVSPNISKKIITIVVKLLEYQKRS
jgi:hypothetical protein